jgi:peroxiredoxin Q/BCP
MQPAADKSRTATARAGIATLVDATVGVCDTLTMLTLNTVAPDFELPDEHGTTVHLEGLRGQWVLLWWYPKAATPG